MVFEPCKGMEKIILRDPEQCSKLLVVFGHQFRLGWGEFWVLLAALMRNLQDIVYVFNSAESFGVQVQDTGSFQLGKSSLQMQLDRLVRPSFPATNLQVEIDDNDQ